MDVSVGGAVDERRRGVGNAHDVVSSDENAADVRHRREIARAFAADVTRKRAARHLLRHAHEAFVESFGKGTRARNVAFDERNARAKAPALIERDHILGKVSACVLK